MRARLLWCTAAAVLLAAACLGFYAWTHRFVREDADLLRYLPNSSGAFLYLNVQQLRPVFPLPARHDDDYNAFVKATGFDYERDLNLLAAELTISGQVTVVAKGRFHWRELSQYAQSHGGSCAAGSHCTVPTRFPGRSLAFYPIQPDVLAAVVGGSSSTLLPRGEPVAHPTGPAFLQLSPEILAQSQSWPAPLRLLAATLAPAAPVTFTVEPAVASSAAAAVLNLSASAPTPAAASAIRTQLEIQTKLLQLQLARAHIAPNPADLTGILTSGDFQVAGRTIHGTWPITRQFLQQLQ